MYGWDKMCASLIILFTCHSIFPICVSDDTHKYIGSHIETLGCQHKKILEQFWSYFVKQDKVYGIKMQGKR